MRKPNNIWMIKISILAAIAAVCLFGCGRKSTNTNLEQGMELVAQYDFQGALACFDLARLNKEDLQLTSRGEGLAYMGLGDYASAQSAFLESIQNAGNTVTALEYDTNYYLAAAYMKQGKYDDAENVYSAIIALKRKELDAYYLRACVMLKKNNYEAAVSDFEKAKTFGGYVSGTKVTQTPEILFARLDPKEVDAKVAELAERQMEASGQTEESDTDVINIEPKAEITYDDFAKMQFQVGEIISCEAVPKSKKLLCSQVKIGSQVKQIVSGIKAYYTPEEMVGKKVMVLVNLKPAKLAGVVSEGMLLCAEDADGNLALMTPERAMPSGAEIM